MVRHYQRKTEQGQTTHHTMMAAVDEVILQKKPVRTVASAHNIPHVTLSRYCKKKSVDNNMTVGYRQPRIVFSPEDESRLSSHLKTSSDIFYGLSPRQVRTLALNFAEAKQLKFPASWKTNGMAGADWFASFMKRNSDLSIRTPEATSPELPGTAARDVKSVAPQSVKLPVATECCVTPVVPQVRLMDSLNKPCGNISAEEEIVFDPSNVINMVENEDIKPDISALLNDNEDSKPEISFHSDDTIYIGKNITVKNEDFEYDNQDEPLLLDQNNVVRFFIKTAEASPSRKGTWEETGGSFSSDVCGGNSLKKITEKIDKEILCSEHQKTIAMWCKDCSVLACVTCIVTKHKSDDWCVLEDSTESILQYMNCKANQRKEMVDEEMIVLEKQLEYVNNEINGRKNYIPELMSVGKYLEEHWSNVHAGVVSKCLEIVDKPIMKDPDIINSSSKDLISIKQP